MNKPKLIVHSVASIDGRITLAPETLLLFGDERWKAVAGSGEDVYRKIMTTYHPQVILEGSGSLTLDTATPEALPPFNGETSPLYEDFLPAAIVERKGQRGWLAVTDSRGRVRWLYKEYPGEEWQGWHLLVLTSRSTPPQYLAYLQRENIPYLVAGDEQVDLTQVLEKLHTALGVNCIVSTAGGRLNGALLRAGLVDEVDLQFFPAVIGGRGTPALFDAPPLRADELPTRLELISSQVQEDGRIHLHYRVISPSHQGVADA